MLNFSNLYRLQVKFQKVMFRGKTQSKWFLFSLTLIILLPFPIYIFPENKTLIFEIALSLVVFFGVQLVSDTLKHFLIGLLLGTTSLLMIWLNFLESEVFQIILLKSISILIFLIYIGYYLLSFLKYTKIINLNMILVSIAGYLLLGIFGGQLFSLLYAVDPNAFNINGNNQLFNLTYYSFTTLTSLGFGDILPTSARAQSLSLIIGLAGELYITILVAIIIGKYLMQNQSPTQ